MNSERRPHVPELFVRSCPAPSPNFVNRDEELRRISTWAANIDTGSILTILGIGGIGKTALASAWFNNDARSVALFQGCLWWSFYEEGANHFLIECFSYLTSTPVSESVALRPEALAVGIARRLQEGRFLLVLDGLEREMSAYSVSPGTATSAAITSHSMRGLGSEMARLLHLCARRESASKILLTSRFAPVDLEDADGRPLSGVDTLQLGPLEETAARQLFSHFGIKLSPELMELARRFEFHPLLLSLMARQLAGGPTPRELLPEEVPLGISVRNFLGASIGELKPEDRIVAEQVAVFDAPIHYSALMRALRSRIEFMRDSELDQSLSRLQNLGLVTWNQAENTYAIHPVIRSAMRQNSLSLPLE